MLPPKGKQTKTRAHSMSELYNLTMKSAGGDDVSFSDYRGEALLIVNLASQ